jgi:putative SOS response-associated peptidase YedK
MHSATRAAAKALAVPFHVIVTDPDEPYDEWLDAASESSALERAYDAYDTQFSRVGDHVTHVGGQADRVVRAAGLRLG